MKPYKDIDGDSGVIAYEYGEDYIKVQFKTGIYTYTNLSAGADNINTMKKLADAGEGLNAFIIKNKIPYALKM